MAEKVHPHQVKEPEMTEVGTIAVETEYVAVGLMRKGERIHKIRVGGGNWRDPKDNDWNALLLWLARHGFKPTNKAIPMTRSGTQRAKYFFGRDLMVSAQQLDVRSQGVTSYGK